MCTGLVEKCDHIIEVEEFKTMHKISSNNCEIPNFPMRWKIMCIHIFMLNQPKVLKQNDSGNKSVNKLVLLKCRHQSMTAMAPASSTGGHKCNVFNRFHLCYVVFALTFIKRGWFSRILTC